MEAPFGIVSQKELVVPMRAGGRLATAVYRPAREGAPASGRTPALLGRTSYDKETDWCRGAGREA